MNRPLKISNRTNYRKVYLSDLSMILEIYKCTQANTANGIHSFPVEKLTAQFGLPLAIAECDKELIGFTSAKMNDLEEIEFTSYYKNGADQTENHPNLEQVARHTYHSTFDTGPGAEKKLSNASLRLIDWLNKCV